MKEIFYLMILFSQLEKISIHVNPNPSMMNIGICEKKYKIKNADHNLDSKQYA